MRWKPNFSWFINVAWYLSLRFGANSFHPMMFPTWARTVIKSITTKPAFSVGCFSFYGKGITVHLDKISEFIKPEFPYGPFSESFPSYLIIHGEFPQFYVALQPLQSSQRCNNLCTSVNHRQPSKTRWLTFLESCSIPILGSIPMSHGYIKLYHGDLPIFVAIQPSAKPKKSAPSGRVSCWTSSRACDGWFKGKSRGNHWFYHEILGVQSISPSNDNDEVLLWWRGSRVLFIFPCFNLWKKKKNRWRNCVSANLGRCSQQCNDDTPFLCGCITNDTRTKLWQDEVTCYVFSHVSGCELPGASSDTKFRRILLMT